MSQQTSSSNGFGRFLGILLRLIFVVLIGILIGGGIFYAVVVGGPALYRAYVLPIENNIARIDSAQSGQADFNEFLLGRVESIQERLDNLEGQSDGYRQALSELQTQVDGFEANIETDKGEIQNGLDDLRQETETQLAELQSALDDMGSALDSLNDQIGDLETAAENNAQSVVEMQTAMAAEDAPVAALRRELRLVQAMELLTRARLNISENNIGRATEDITAAQQLLLSLEDMVPAYQIASVAAITKRVDSALELMPDSPVLAADDLEIAWQLLRRGLPGEVELQAAPDAAPSDAEATPTPSAGS